MQSIAAATIRRMIGKSCIPNFPTMPPTTGGVRVEPTYALAI